MNNKPFSGDWEGFAVKLLLIPLIVVLVGYAVATIFGMLIGVN